MAPIPQNRPRTEKLPKATDWMCPRRNCKGILFDVSSRLAIATGVRHVECDQCRNRWAIPFPEEA